MSFVEHEAHALDLTGQLSQRGLAGSLLWARLSTACPGRGYRTMSSTAETRGIYRALSWFGFSIAVIDIMTKRNLWREGFISA